MSAKMKGDVKKTVDKAVSVKNITTKKVTQKSKTDSKQGQKNAKKEGRIFKDKGIQTESVGKIKISGEDLTSEGKY